MILAFCMGPAASIIQSCRITCQKIGKSLHGENISILNRKPKLSDYFRRVRTFQFLSRDLATMDNTLSTSHGLGPLAAGYIRNYKIMESLILGFLRDSDPAFPSSSYPHFEPCEPNSNL